MKKSLTITITVAALLLGTYFVYNSLFSFELFEETPQPIEIIKDTGKDYDIAIYYIPGNATTQSNIQVRKVLDKNEKVLENFERYNFLESTKIRNDTLILRINDTSRNHVKAKNFFIKLPN